MIIRQISKLCRKIQTEPNFVENFQIQFFHIFTNSGSWLKKRFVIFWKSPILATQHYHQVTVSLMYDTSLEEDIVLQEEMVQKDLAMYI